MSDLITIKNFIGYSGSKVELLQLDDITFVRKIGQVDRNLERLEALQLLGLSVPKILYHCEEYYDMEYIRHVDIVNWLTQNSIDSFSNWVLSVVDKFAQTSQIKDYTAIYEARLYKNITFEYLSFDSNELFDKLPKLLPSSEYHGDLTLDNCLYGTDDKFYLIDPLTSEFDSWVFDLAKLMQDLECNWAIRNKSILIQGKLLDIKNVILKKYPIVNNYSLTILMLLRVFPYANNKQDKEFLLREIERLWIL